MAKYRTNDIEGAIKDLHDIAVMTTKANCFEISTMALTNAAIVTSKLKRFEEAYKLSRLAIDQSKKINTWKSFEVSRIFSYCFFFYLRSKLNSFRCE